VPSVDAGESVVAHFIGLQPFRKAKARTKALLTKMRFIDFHGSCEPPSERRSTRWHFLYEWGQGMDAGISMPWAGLGVARPEHVEGLRQGPSALVPA